MEAKNRSAIEGDWFGSKSKFPSERIRKFCLQNRKKNETLSETNLLSLSYGEIIRKDINGSEGLRPESFSSYQIVDSGDLVVRLLDLQNDQRSLRTALVKETGIITSAYVGLVVDRSLALPDFVAYSFRAMDQSKYLYSLGAGVRQSLKAEEFLDLKIPLPSLEIQRNIVDYLDKETSEIDTLVGELDEYIELLEKQHRVVLKKYVDQLASENEEVQCKFLVETTTGSGDTQDADPEGEYPFYVRSDTIERSTEWTFDTNAVLTSGDGAGVGKIFHLAAGKFHAHQRVYVMRNFRLVTPEYFYWAFKQRFSQSILYGGAKSTVESVRMNMITDLKIPVPDLDTQDRIVQRLQENHERFSLLIRGCAELKEILLKRRQVLITDVVTGKVEV